MTSDRIFGLAVLAVALFYLYSATAIQLGFLSDPVGSRTFPYLIGSVAALCGIYICIKPDPDPNWPAWPIIAKLAAATAVMYVFARLLKPMGFILPAAVASALLSYLISPNVKISIIAGICLSLGLYLIFRAALGLSLSPFGDLF